MPPKKKEENKNIWMPTSVQQTALLRQEFEVLFGGARGGGKSAAGIAWLLYDIDIPEYRGLVIRRNADDLRDWIDRATQFYAKVGAEKKGTPVEFHFPSGAIIRTGHLADDDAYSKYQGHEYHRILIEELTQISSERNYLLLIASCRSTVEGLRPQVFMTTNPGGAGHSWVKRRFIDVADPCTPYTDMVSGRQRIFIPAKVTDNPHIMERDPDYVKMLDALPTHIRDAWRNGSWEQNEVDGSYYQAQMSLMHREKRICNLPVEMTLPVHTVWDIGVSDSTAIWFLQFVGNDIRWVDYYEASGEGLMHYVEMLKSKPYVYGTHYAPHDIEVREYTSGVSRIETARKMGINFQIVDKMSIQDGIDALRIVLGYSWFDIVRCEKGLEALKNYRKEWNDKMNEYKPTPIHDWTSHAADAARYAAIVANKLRNTQNNTPLSNAKTLAYTDGYIYENGTAFQMYE